MKKLAVLMDLPEGKLPGFYAQIVKGLANNVELFDRDKEMLIVSGEKERDAVTELLDRYQVHFEQMELILLPEDARLSDKFSDFGFTSRAGRHYLYAGMVSVFRFASCGAAAEPEQARMQMEEHLIAEYADDGVAHYVVQEQLAELMRGIAKAYQCTVEFVER